MVRLLDTFTAARILGLMRTMLTLWVVCWGMGVGVSHAQDCGVRSVVVNKSPLPTVRFNVSNFTGAKVIDTFSSTAIFSACSGFANNVWWNVNLDPTFVFSMYESGNYIDSGGTWRVFLNCGNPARCFDINNVALTPSSTSGISLTTRITMRGTQANGTVCHDAPSLSSGTFTSNGVLQSVSLSLNANAKDCDKFVINVESVLTQEAVFSPSNTAKIILNPPTLQPASGFLTGPNQMGSKIFTLFPNSTNFIAASGTCALSLSNTNLNMGMVSPERISATPRNEVVMSKPLIMTVNNCTGFASGKNKVMQWVFTTPNSKDRTRMENALVTGGASGISAQIVADNKFDLSGNAMASRTITNGENYITSGKTSDNQTLNYQVNLIRNTDAVNAGAFSSTATVTLSYQ